MRLVERYQWALAPALLCLLLSFWREFPVRPRPRDIRLGEDTDAGEEARPNPAMRRAGAAAVLALLLAAGAGRARAAAEPTADPASPAALAHIVGRLAAADTRSARDWAELAGETLSWGGRVQSAQQPVPEGPVHDALASVDAGAALDPHAADWPKLRAELEGLLQKPSSQQQQQQNQQQQKQPQQNQSQSQQEQQQQQQNQQNSGQSQSQQQQQQQQQQGQSGQNPQQNQQQTVLVLRRHEAAAPALLRPDPEGGRRQRALSSRKPPRPIRPSRPRWKKWTRSRARTHRPNSSR